MQRVGENEFGRGILERNDVQTENDATSVEKVRPDSSDSMNIENEMLLERLAGKFYMIF